MSSLFSPAFFANNRRQLQAALQTDVPIVITSNGLLQRGADVAFNFAQDANFWYLTGINEPDITLVMDGQREFLFAPVRESVREAFDGVVDHKGMARRSGIKEVINEAAGWKRLDELVTKNKRVATLAAAPNYIESMGIYANPARMRLQERLHKHVPDLELIDIRTPLARLRMIKQLPELQAIQKAIDITNRGLKDAMVGDRTRFKYEYQMEAVIAAGFRGRGASGHAFEPIVAGGKRACTLHSFANNGKLAVDELVLLDVGAEYEHYAADIGRVIALQKPTPRQQAVFDAVVATQAYAFELLKPGVKMRSYELLVRKFLAQQIRQLGLAKTLKEAAGLIAPHATSHYLGLNAHDVGDYDAPLQPGIVMTVEPGIYIPQEGIGIRIEDDVLITEQGIQILSDSLPRKLF